jgi:hypothetical protein
MKEVVILFVRKTKSLLMVNAKTVKILIASIVTQSILPSALIATTTSSLLIQKLWTARVALNQDTI